MTNSKTDRRVLRTRRMLSTALIELILERGYDALTIQDITERADLRRATFYLHYKDKEELLLTTLEGIFEELVCQLEPITQGDLLAGKTRVESLLVIFQHVEDNADLYRIMLASQGAAVISGHIRNYLAGMVKQALDAVPQDSLPMPADVLANYAAGAELALITWWLESGQPYPVERMAQMVHTLILDGLRGSMGELLSGQSDSRQA